MSKVLHKIIFVFFLNFAMLPGPAQADQVLDVPLTLQEHSMWCWAATTVGVLRYYGNDHVSQVDVVHYRTNRDDCASGAELGFDWENPWVDEDGELHPCNRGRFTTFIQDNFLHWGTNADYINRHLEFSEVSEEINAGRPFTIRYDWKNPDGTLNDSAHHVIGRGLVGDMVYIMDPWPKTGEVIRAYDNVVESLDHVWSCGLKTAQGPESVPLAATGQQLSYGDNDDGALQKGIAWPDPRFTDKQDGTVTDNLTGLVWLKDPGCFGKEAWHDSLTAANQLAHGDCDLMDGSIPGDWHLPNRKQLESLVDISQPHPSLPAGHPFIGIGDELHCWSSSSYAEHPEHTAWTVDITNGNSVCPKTDLLCVWPVSDGSKEGVVQLHKTGQTISYGDRDDGELQKGAQWPEPDFYRFTDNQDGTVTDNLTDLVWLKNADCFGKRTWVQAISGVRQLEDGSCGLADGSSPGDWYLPNRNQLASLVDISEYNPALPQGHPFTGVHGLHVWSGNTYAEEDDFAWTVTFSSIDYFPNGYQVWYPKAPFAGFPMFDKKLSVWPVRKTEVEAVKTLPGVLMLLLDEE